MMSEHKQYGPVQDGVIKHLAVTGVQTFNHDEEGCQSKWYYENVEKRPRPQKMWHTKGIDVDDQVNHYLSTGENVLGRTARAGIHLLPEPGPDLLVQWGLNNKLREKKPDGKWKNYFPPEESKLWAAGIPFVGFPDLINARQQYLVPSDDNVPSDGQEQRLEVKIEPGVVEVLDNKTSSDFKWAKPSNKLFHNTQMNGYGLFIVNIEPEVVGVRLSHNTYRTDNRKAPAAIKRSVLVTPQEIRERWTRVVEPVVEQMKSVAAMKRDVDVPFNLSACDSFGGCPHKDYCHAQKKLNPFTRIKMATLLKNRTGAAAPPASAAPPPPNGAAGNMPWLAQQPQPPMPPAGVAPMQPQAPQPPAPPAPPAAPQHAAPPPPPPPQLAPPPPPPQQQAAPPPQAPPPAPAPQQTPTPIAAQYANQGGRYWVNGVLTQYLCSTGGKQSFVPLDPSSGQMVGTPILVDYAAQVFAIDAASAAPAAPAPAPQAAPPPPPAPQAPAAAAPPPPPPAADAPKPRGRPRRANMQMQDVPPPAAAPVPMAAPAAAPPAQQTFAEGLSLYVNAVPNGPFIDLSSYVAQAVEDIRSQFNVPDIRIAPEDTPIAYAKWRGVLAGVVRAEPPPPGVYVAFTKGSEFTEVVVEALAPLCATGQFVRGVQA